ncbi:hypothetical protein A9495_08260 [Brachyspira hampsonii]|uniref:CASTOR/POLLUX-related putative ion channel n=1 Tax=Brachyspira hampsonii TaxID=1287055 RepID=UPI0008518E37|nr:hypothetical protein [Brachyspira hampsonii]OEJ17166.1 hypothetical protein A9495_08260 [Brachyspira hampsonii]
MSLIDKLSKYIKYRIDRVFNKGLLYQLMILVLIIVISLFIISVIMKILFNYPILEAFWDSLMQFIDTGNISAAEADIGFNGVVIIFLGVTFFGVCGWGLLIAMINNSLQERIKNLSNGNAFIMERNHSIILGYGEEVLTIISEFISGRAKKIVLLSETNPDEIKKRISFFPNYKRTNIVVREGNPSIFENLQMLNIERAHSVTIVNDDDVKSLKILLSLKKILKSASHIKKIDICILVNKKESIEIISSINDSDLFDIHIIYKYEILYKLIGQSITYTGLSSIYQELFDVSGIDIRIEYNNQNETFESLSSSYLNKREILIGLVYEDISEINKVKKIKKSLLIPNNDYIIKGKDKLVILYQKEENIQNIGTSIHMTDKIIYDHNVLLILDRKKENEIIKEISQYTEKEKIVKLYYEDIENAEIKKDFIASKIAENKISKIVLISETLETDIKAINILLIIRRIVKDHYDIPILSLMSSIENRNLIDSNDIRDFIVSGKLIGMLMATASNNSDLLYVFNDLLTKNGNDIIMVPYEKYFCNNDSMEFKKVYTELLTKNIVAIGVKHKSNIILNPKADDKVNRECEIIIIIDENIKK